MFLVIPTVPFSCFTSVWVPVDALLSFVFSMQGICRAHRARSSCIALPLCYALAQGRCYRLCPSLRWLRCVFLHILTPLFVHPPRTAASTALCPYHFEFTYFRLLLLFVIYDFPCLRLLLRLFSPAPFLSVTTALCSHGSASGTMPCFSLCCLLLISVLRLFCRPLPTSKYIHLVMQFLVYTDAAIYFFTTFPVTKKKFFPKPKQRKGKKEIQPKDEGLPNRFCLIPLPPLLPCTLLYRIGCFWTHTSFCLAYSSCLFFSRFSSSTSSLLCAVSHSPVHSHCMRVHNVCCTSFIYTNSSGRGMPLSNPVGCVRK